MLHKKNTYLALASFPSGKYSFTVATMHPWVTREEWDHLKLWTIKTIGFFQIATFPGIFHDINSKLNYIPRTYFSRYRLFRTFTQPLVVDKCAIAAFCILKIKLIGGAELSIFLLFLVKLFEMFTFPSLYQNRAWLRDSTLQSKMALFKAGLTLATERPTLIALSSVKSRS